MDPHQTNERNGDCRLTYVMSDLHGCWREYQEALEKIAFLSSDRLYIIGDIVDRGPDVVSILKDVMKRDNVRVLAENHEYMGLQVLGKSCKKGLTTPLSDMTSAGIESCLLWMNDGGDQTLRQLKRGGDEALQRVAAYLADLSLYGEVSAGSRDYLLVHAGLEPFQPEKPLEEYGPAELLFHQADYNRPYFRDRYTITGHTPTFFIEGAQKGYSGSFLQFVQFLLKPLNQFSLLLRISRPLQPQTCRIPLGCSMCCPRVSWSHFSGVT